MTLKYIILLLVLLSLGNSAIIYSSFWAPLFDHRILNYRVDATFDPNAARSAREQYAKDYGYRGEALIADLGNGNGPGNQVKDVKISTFVQRLTKAEGTIPMRTTTTGDDCVHMIVYLASNEVSRVVTGAIVPVDGALQFAGSGNSKILQEQMK